VAPGSDIDGGLHLKITGEREKKRMKSVFQDPHSNDLYGEVG